MNRLRISNPLLLLTAGSLIATLLLAVWLSSGNWGGSAAAAEDSEVVLSTAFSISRNASSMAVSASTPTSYTMPPNTLARLSASFEESKARLQEDLSILVGKGHDEQVALIRQHVGALTANIELIEAGRPDFLHLQQESQADFRYLEYEINKPLDAALVTSMDDQLHLMVMGDGSLTADDTLVYHHLFNLMESSRMLVSRMRAASVTRNPRITALLQEDHDAAYQRVSSSLAYLSLHGAETLAPEVLDLSAEMLELGRGEDNLWDKMYVRQAKEAREGELMEVNRLILDDLLRKLDALVAEVSQ